MPFTQREIEALNQMRDRQQTLSAAVELERAIREKLERENADLKRQRDELLTAVLVWLKEVDNRHDVSAWKRADEAKAAVRKAIANATKGDK